MSYRFQKITTIYPAFVHQFLADNPDYRHLSYDQLYERYVRAGFAWADFYGRHLQTLGHWTQEIFANVEPLQKAWAREHGTTFSRTSWCKDIVLTQVKSFKPDVLFLQDLYFFDRDFRKQLREACGKNVLMIGWQAAPTEDFSVLRDVDLMLTCAPHFAERMRASGVKAVLLHHAFEPALLKSLPASPKKDLDFTFIGGFVLRNGFHRERHALIGKLTQSTPLQVWGEVSEARVLSRESQVIIRISHALKVSMERKGIELTGGLLDRLTHAGYRMFLRSRPRAVPVKDSYANKFHGPVFGLRYLRILARSKMTFNSHIDCAEQYAGNLRLFEATGVGTCLITDRKTNLRELFAPDAEVVTYGGAEECIEKVNYLLDHNEQCEAIAAAGQRRTMRDHTFQQRAVVLDELIRRNLR